MRVAEMDWRMVEDWARHDDRVVLPLGGTARHGPLSLATSTILAESIAAEAAEPLGIPVFPALPYGLAHGTGPYFGTLTLRVSTYATVLTDLLDSLVRSGFRRILIVTAHDGDTTAESAVAEWITDKPDCVARVHHCWGGGADGPSDFRCTRLAPGIPRPDDDASEPAQPVDDAAMAALWAAAVDETRVMLETW